MQRGLLVTFEGIDGSGKSTQVEEFILRLKREEIPFLLVREPGGTDIGERIRDTLLDKGFKDMFPLTELFLYSASRFQLTNQIIIPAIKSGKVVVCDRFYDSTTAYQGYGRGIDLHFVRLINKFATKSIVPDLTFIIDISIEERARRLKEKELDRLEGEDVEFQKRVREGFLSIAKEEPDRVVMVNGSLPPEIVAGNIWNHFKEITEGGERL